MLSDLEICADGTLDSLALADEVGDSANTESHRAICVIHLDGDLVGVADQCEWEVMLVPELLVAAFSLRADADDLETD